MRIIAGSLGGRTFDSPSSHRTHPMSERVRGGLFNALGDIEGLTVLDAFAGSGALSFEALSRGAKKVTAIEIDRPAIQSITKAATELAVTHNIHIIHASLSGWLRTATDTFDLILADPPYDNLQVDLLPALLDRVKTNGLLILSWPGGQPLPKLQEAVLLNHKTYGDAELAFYRRTT